MEFNLFSLLIIIIQFFIEFFIVKSVNVTQIKEKEVFNIFTVLIMIN